ncbi:hypothetical protein [Roseateles sp. PN1]|uniref:hypothetical protein n=1 Tax=Roseateles sp. PN1 TaxID=3137372 RepID=UPI00313928B8
MRTAVLVKASLALLAWTALAATAAEPRNKNLWVEMRWVESSVSGAALAGVRDGAVVVGTAGSVSPRGQIVLSTQRRDEAAQQIQRVLVLNGGTASVQLSEQTPVQWLDYGVQLEAGTVGGRPALGGNGAPNGSHSGAKVLALPRTGWVERSSGFTVNPQWPGGQQPVRVTLTALSAGPNVGGGSAGDVPGQGRQAQFQSTVMVPLGEWLTVARSGAELQRAERGVTSSRDAEMRSLRELQIRVELAP